MKEKLENLPVGAELHFIQKIEEGKEYHYWYGGRVAEIKYKGFRFVLGAYGDVYASLYRQNDGVELFRVKDKYNGGNLYSELSLYINNDDELEECIAGLHLDYELEIDYNNWWEYYIVCPNGEILDNGDICESDYYSQALNEMIDSIESFVEEYEQYERDMKGTAVAP